MRMAYFEGFGFKSRYIPEQEAWDQSESKKIADWHMHKGEKPVVTPMNCPVTVWDSTTFWKKRNV